MNTVADLEKLCADRGLTIGLAESCTGGLMSSLICERPGASKYFVGSVVSYARDVKENVLRVPRQLMQVHGEVSIPVAKAMAIGAREVLNCDWSVSITGIAGPSGGSKEKPVGTVCFAVAGPGFVSFESKLFPGERGEVQRHAANFAFELLLKAMQ